MSQGLREMLSNRRFAIPLIVLLAFIFIGLILVGVVLILRPGAEEPGTRVAAATSTMALEPTERPASTLAPTNTPTASPTPTLVPVATQADSAAGPESTDTAEAAAESTAESTEATPESTSPSTSAEATATPSVENELADTGIGWGLILLSGFGLAALVLVTRRLRLAR